LPANYGIYLIMADLREQLGECLEGRFCLMGLGNSDYGDDGLGVRLAERLFEAGLPDVIVAGTKARLLGVQPESLKTGAGLSRAVEETVDLLYHLILDAGK
jgi:Ni,Fe-hydrogenase maturation factor